MLSTRIGYRNFGVEKEKAALTSFMAALFAINYARYIGHRRHGRKALPRRLSQEAV